MEIKHLISFVAVADLGSMTVAARHLNLTQAAVSLHIRTLERDLGVKLFIRCPHSVKLTETGEMFLPRARSIVMQEKECFEEIASLNGHICGTINIGAGCFIEPYIGYDVAKFMLQYPEVNVNMHYDYAHILNDQLRCNQLDIAFSMNEGTEDEGIVSTPCYSFQLCAIMSKKHYLAHQEKVSFEDIVKCRILMPDNGKREMQTIQRFVGADMQRILDSSRCKCNNANALLNGLEFLDAITFLPCEYVINRHNLIALPIDGFERTVNSNYHVMSNVPMKASVKALLDIINSHHVVGKQLVVDWTAMD